MEAIKIKNKPLKIGQFTYKDLIDDFGFKQITIDDTVYFEIHGEFDFYLTKEVYKTPFERFVLQWSRTTLKVNLLRLNNEEHVISKMSIENIKMLNWTIAFYKNNPTDEE